MLLPYFLLRHLMRCLPRRSHRRIRHGRGVVIVDRPRTVGRLATIENVPVFSCVSELRLDARVPHRLRDLAGVFHPERTQPIVVFKFLNCRVNLFLGILR